MRAERERGGVSTENRKRKGMLERERGRERQGRDRERALSSGPFSCHTHLAHLAAAGDEVSSCQVPEGEPAESRTLTACTCVCSPCVCPIPAEARREHQSPGSLELLRSYGQL